MCPDRLRRVDQQRNILPPCAGGNFADRVDRAEHVRHLRDCNQARFFAKQAVRLREVHAAVAVERNNAQPGAAILADALPGQKIGVMLHLAHPDFITGPQPRAGPALRNQVDRFGCRTGEDDLLRTPGIDEIRDGSTCSLVMFTGIFSQRIEPAVNRSVLVAVTLTDRFDDNGGFLRAGGRVQIMQRLRAGSEDREVSPKRLEINRVRVLR